MAKIAIMVGSVYGATKRLANLVVPKLGQLGHQAELFYPASLAAVQAFAADHWLILTSTTGHGEIPDDLLPFYHQVHQQFPMLTGKSWAVIVLGDSSYFETYCGAGDQWHALLSQLYGTELTAMLKIDAGETLQPETVVLPWLHQHYASL